MFLFADILNQSKLVFWSLLVSKLVCLLVLERFWVLLNWTEQNQL